MLLQAGPLLLLEGLDVELPEVVSLYLDALVGEDVRGRSEDLLRVVVGHDPDKGAVHVETDRSDVHGHCFQSSFTDRDLRLVVGYGLAAREAVCTTSRSDRTGVHPTRSSSLACTTNLPPYSALM
jgi:hypothetical protein